MKDLAVFTALSHSGSIGKNFVKFKKINMLFTGLGSVRMVKNCDLGLEMFFTIRTSQPANNTYIYIFFVFLVQKKGLEENVGEK